MILTIGMIVKNEEKYLRSCLEAIEPLLKQVSSELIIADTGSTDTTVEIAKEFTDNVFHFEWCDDFSAARNSTLERAQGEWYLYIDADEIFQDVSELIRFFNSGEYKKYNSATITIRSYNDKAGKVFADYDAPRLVRIMQDTRFVKRIHETVPHHTQKRRLEVLVNHYGYVSEDNQDFIEQKVERNRDLLLKELKQRPQDCKLYLEIGQNCQMSRDLDSALEYFNKGVKYAKQQKHWVICELYAEIAQVLFQKEQWEGVLETAVSYESVRGTGQETDLPIFYFAGKSNFTLKRYQEAITGFTKYIEVFQAYHNRKTDQEGGRRTSAAKLTNRHSYRMACLDMAQSYLEMGDFSSVREILEQVPLSEWREDERGIGVRLALEINLMGEIQDYSRLPEMFRELEGKYLEQLQTMVEQITDGSRRKLLLTEIACSDLEETDYIRLLKLRYTYYCTETLNGEMIERFFREKVQWKPMFADAAYFALHSGVSLRLLAAEIDAYDLNEILFSNPFLHFGDLPQVIFRRIMNQAESNDPAVQLWLLRSALWALNSGQLDREQTLLLFHVYGKLSSRFLSVIYQKEILTGKNISLLPKELRFAYYCGRAEGFLSKGENSSYVEELKALLKFVPEWGAVIKLLLEELKMDMNRENEKDGPTEFQEHAAAVKKNIRALLDMGKRNEATELFNVYAQLCPDDPELTDLISGAAPTTLLS